MSWQKKPIPAPLLDGIEELSSSLSSVIQPVVTLLDTASSALGAAKFLFSSASNPTTELALLLIDEVENLNNDIFGTGVFQLVVQPFKISQKFGVPLIGQIGPIDTEAKLVEISQTGGGLTPNDLGIPNLTPKNCIDKILQSFDDEGDAERPIFSDSANVTAFGFLISAPDVSGFRSLLEGFNNVWEFGEFSRILDRFKEALNEETEGVTPFPSRPPDWDSVRLNSVKLMKDTQDELNKQLQFVKGLVGSADDLIGDFLTLIERKVNSMKIVVEDLDLFINTIKDSTSASGIYVLDVPPGPGGVNRLKEEIRDAQFSSSRDNISAAVIYVGGGASLEPVNALRSLVAS